MKRKARPTAVTHAKEDQCWCSGDGKDTLEACLPGQARLQPQEQEEGLLCCLRGLSKQQESIQTTDN